MKAIILAIILAESSFNPKAYNKGGNATGLMQITPIGAKEARRQCKLDKKPDLFNPKVNLDYGTCLYDYYRKISRSDVEALLLYHGGFVARNRFRKGLNAGPKTSNYVMRVLNFKERFESNEINVNAFCAKYPELPVSICPKRAKDQKK